MATVTFEEGGKAMLGGSAVKMIRMHGDDVEVLDAWARPPAKYIVPLVALDPMPRKVQTAGRRSAGRVSWA